MEINIPTPTQVLSSVFLKLKIEEAVLISCKTLDVQFIKIYTLKPGTSLVGRVVFISCEKLDIQYKEIYTLKPQAAQ